MKRVLSYGDIINQVEKLTKSKGAGVTLPAKLKNLEAVFVDWDRDAILENLPKLDPEQKDFIRRHNARIIASYMYGAGVWDKLAKEIGYRRNAGVLGPGIQMATDNMPQGELIQIPLTRYTGRQNQAHVLVHFTECVVDYGRKGFDKDFVDIAKVLATSVVQDTFSKVRDCLRTEDVKAKSLLLGDKVATWKKGLEQRENEAPLILQNENFFLPINEISVTSEPSREQDVIALFNQLVAGGVIRGIKIVGTHEMMTYDGAYRIRVGPNYDDHTYDEETNPLGVHATSLDEFREVKPEGFVSTELKVLEYKYSINGLITDMTTGDKKAADIDLLVAWEAGTEYTKYFELRSYLLEDGRENREYHGVTHGLFDEHGHHVMDAILLKDLISYLNDPIEEAKHQSEYEEV